MGGNSSWGMGIKPAVIIKATILPIASVNVEIQVYVCHTVVICCRGGVGIRIDIIIPIRWECIRIIIVNMYIKLLLID